MSASEYAMQKMAGMKDYARQVVYENPMASSRLASSTETRSGERDERLVERTERFSDNLTDRGSDRTSATELAAHKIAGAKDYAKQVCFHSLISTIASRH